MSLEGLTDRTSWGEAAKRVDDALDQCDISGQWSEAAKAALVDDAPLPESLTQRMEEVEQKIRAWMQLEDTSLIRRATLEVYREGS